MFHLTIDCDNAESFHLLTELIVFQIKKGEAPISAETIRKFLEYIEVSLENPYAKGKESHIMGDLAENVKRAIGEPSKNGEKARERADLVKTVYLKEWKDITEQFRHIATLIEPAAMAAMDATLRP